MSDRPNTPVAQPGQLAFAPDDDVQDGYAMVGWNGPGDSLDGLLCADDAGGFAGLDAAFEEPEFARLQRAGLSPSHMFAYDTTIAPLDDNNGVFNAHIYGGIDDEDATPEWATSLSTSVARGEDATFADPSFVPRTTAVPSAVLINTKQYKTTDAGEMRTLHDLIPVPDSSIADVISLGVSTPMNPTSLGREELCREVHIDPRLSRSRTVRIPIADRTTGRSNPFDLTAAIADIVDLHTGTWFTNLRVEGAVIPCVTGAELVVGGSTNIVDCIGPSCHWRSFRALCGDDQTDEGRLPFPLLLRGRRLPMMTHASWVLRLTFDRSVRTVDTSTSYIAFDIVGDYDNSRFTSIPYLRFKNGGMEQGPNFQMLGYSNPTYGLLVRSASEAPIGLCKLHLKSVGAEVTLDSTFQLGEWSWFPFGQSMLINVPADRTLHLSRVDNVWLDVGCTGPVEVVSVSANVLQCRDGMANIAFI